MNNEKYWNDAFKNETNNQKTDYLNDIWMEKYKDIINQNNIGIALDLGCGLGQDSLYLKQKGYDVTACDISTYALDQIKEKYPEIKTRYLDVSKKLPFEDNSISLINANLSLHYFTMKKTKEIFEEIRRILKPGGIFIGRMNSDKNDFANENTEIIEENYYYDSRINVYRRLFDQKQFDELTPNWNIIVLREDETIRIGNKKYMWEFILQKGENMNTSNIEINTQSSIKIKSEKIIYFDPYKIENEMHDADIIFITHNHYDHMDNESIEKIKNENTTIVAPKSMEEVINKIEFKNYIYLEPFDEINIENINIKTIPAYNREKQFHPRTNNWLGYIIKLDNTTYYIAGDTDVTKENENIKCDIAFIPIGGHFTMDVKEATELIKKINPKIVIPIHYGSIIGEPIFGKILKENLSNTNIEVIEKLEF